MRTSATSLCSLLAGLFLLASCSEATLDLSPLYEPAAGGPGPSDLTLIDPGGCGFEDNDLTDFGHPGEVLYIGPEGGKVAIVEEHANYSALAGEDGVDFHGDFALLIRSNDAGDPETTAVVRTLPFVPNNPLFVVDQLSEVGSEGIALSARVLSEDGEELELWELDVVTGGYVPALEEWHEPIEGFPEITDDSAQAGEFTRQYLDTSPWQEAGEAIVLEFRQHTRVQNNGFFTLFDNLCDGEPATP